MPDKIRIKLNGEYIEAEKGINLKSFFLNI